jgi:hypothetical protein
VAASVTTTWQLDGKLEAVLDAMRCEWGRRDHEACAATTVGGTFWVWWRFYPSPGLVATVSLILPCVLLLHGRLMNSFCLLHDIYGKINKIKTFGGIMPGDQPDAL